MKRQAFVNALMSALLITVPALALELGDPAPALKVEKWIKGGPIDLKAGQGKNVFVIEFWATWCAPCRASIPHLTDVQKKYKERGVVVVGISVDGGAKHPTRAQVEPFVKEWGEKMDYVVALDTEERTTMEAYMTPFMLNGIPCAFVVDKEGRLVWAGDPRENLEKVLDEVLAGKYDLEAAKKADQERRKLAAKEAAARQLLAKYFETVTASDKPENVEQLGMLVFIGLDNNPVLLNELAWDILTREDVKYRDLKLALRAAKVANERSDAKNPAILDTYARALFDNGHVQEAIETQKKAVGLATDPEMKVELEQALKRYEAAGK